MSTEAIEYNYDINDIKFAVVALQLGLVTANEAENALNALKKRNIEPNEQNFARTLLILSYLNKQDIEILDYYTKNHAEICWCQDCSKNYIVTNFRADRSYNCPICSGPLYLVHSPAARFYIGDLEPIDGLDPLSQPFISQMQGVKPESKDPDYQKMSVAPGSIDEEDLFNIYDSTIPKFSEGKSITAKIRKKEKDSERIKKFNQIFKQIQKNRLKKPDDKNQLETDKNKEPLQNDVNLKLQTLANKNVKTNQKSIFASMKEANLNVELIDLKQPVAPGVPAGVFPTSETSTKKLDKDTKISLSPIPSVGSKIKIASNDRYVLIKEIARGGMGVVYLAFDQDLRRYVAMKVIKPKENLKLRHIHRFIQESQILAQLEHPNNVPIHEFGVTTNGHLFFTMKYIEGISLAYLVGKYHKNDPVTRQTYPLKKQISLLLKVFDAIAYAHARGVIHRDLKPENIMIGAFGEVVVMDWGLAKVQATRSEVLSDSEDTVSSSKAETSTMATHDGQVVGTPTYMPPEQTTGKAEQIDERCDIYALGAIMFEVITGRPPFIERDVWKLIKRIREADFPAPSLLNPSIDKRLEVIVLKAMNSVIEERYQTVYEFKAAVEDFLNSTIESNLREISHDTESHEQIMVETFDSKRERTPEFARKSKNKDKLSKIAKELLESEKIKHHQSETLQKALEMYEIQSSQSRDKSASHSETQSESKPFSKENKIRNDQELAELAKTESTNPVSENSKTIKNYESGTKAETAKTQIENAPKSEADIHDFIFDEGMPKVEENKLIPDDFQRKDSNVDELVNPRVLINSPSSATKLLEFPIDGDEQVQEIEPINTAGASSYAKVNPTDDDVLEKLKRTQVADKNILKNIADKKNQSKFFIVTIIVLIAIIALLTILLILK